MHAGPCMSAAPGSPSRSRCRGPRRCARGFRARGSCTHVQHGSNDAAWQPLPRTHRDGQAHVALTRSPRRRAAVQRACDCVRSASADPAAERAA
jgi:hypothetical protein